MIKAALQMLWIERKKAINLCLSITASLCVSLVFIQFFTNPHISKVTLKDIYLFTGDFIKMLLAFGIIIVCVCLIAYACNYHVRVHSRELGLVKLAGYNNWEVLKYLLVQIITIVLLAVLLTLILSIFILPLSLYLIYDYLQIEASVFYLSGTMILLELYIIMMILCIIIFLEIHYSMATSICDLLKSHNIVGYCRNKHVFKIPDGIFVLAYLVGIYTMFTGEQFDPGFVISSCIGAAGAYGMFYHVFPHLFYKYLNKGNVNGSFSVVLGDVSLFMQQAKSLIIFIMASVIIMPATILATVDIPIGHISSHLALILINILLSASLVNRFMIDEYEKKIHYRNLYKMGLTRKEVKRISYQVTNWFYGILWIVTSIYLFCIFLMFFINDRFQLDLAIIVFIESIFPYLVSQAVVLIVKGRGNLWE